MNCASFSKMLSEQAAVVALAGDTASADGLRAIAAYFAPKAGTVAKALGAVRLPAQPRQPSAVVRLLQATAKVHQSVSPTSPAAVACTEVADAVSRTEGRTVAEVLDRWHAGSTPAAKPAPAKVAKPATTGTKARSAPKPTAPTSATAPADVVAKYVRQFKSQPAARSLDDLPKLKADKAVKLTELAAILEGVLGEAQPKRTKAAHLEWLERRLLDRRSMDQKDVAFGRA